MVGITQVIIGGVFAAVGLWAAHRLSVVANAALALRGISTDDATRLEDGQPVAVEGRVFVDEPAATADRLFDSTVDPVGAYVWQAWFHDTGRYNYDFDRGESRQGRSTFASGIEAGRCGVTTGGRNLYIDFAWFRETYDTADLSELEVGDPASNTKLPTFLTRYVWDGLYVSLESSLGDCSMDRLTDVVDLYRDDVAAEEFGVESRGITAGQELFVYGELRRRDGEFTIVGTDGTPLLVSDSGREGLTRQLRWRGVKYALTLAVAPALAWLFVFSSI